MQRAEIAPFEQFAHQNTQPDFDLIHPGSVLGRVIKHDLMGWIMQKRCAAFHRAENSACAFDTQCLRSDPLALGYPTNQRLGLMDIQVIHDEMPLCRLRITLNQALKVRQTIFLCAGRSKGDTY